MITGLGVWSLARFTTLTGVLLDSIVYGPWKIVFCVVESIAFFATFFYAEMMLIEGRSTYRVHNKNKKKAKTKKTDIINIGDNTDSEKYQFISGQLDSASLVPEVQTTENTAELLIDSFYNKDDMDKDSNKLLVLYMNYLVDMSSFTHPGGQWILSKIKGREISRYIFGGFKLEGENTRAWNHSHHAKNYLMDNVVADLFDSKDLEKWPLYLNGKPEISREKWIFD